ncbi:lysosomal Pro-X carboxypeptidase isoform X3 [Arachis ipaensis]|uniref:lysosomal Pro-X carboxypeptidase isoform X3 n=1 Tax=Arachis ipaensis TaxID=130454 RepID=UPI0007AF6CA2|nr:lysosomal Pro-X carboxypeptidase isoform X3 [Arachis ipaensis]XP_025658014.1 lysosomal Pro-X carboxypeptidase isoform X2 [Arachis hypogaea]QHN86436.1 Lysosomal Pro-X carboxypeptidase [Arachis hypogaea]
MILATLFSPLSLLLLLFFSISTLSFSHFVPTFPSSSKFHPELTTQLSRSSSSSSSNGLYETKFFTQTLDHFDYTPQSNHKFQQRYLFNDTHWGGANNNAPIFVYTGNEGNIEWFTQNTGFMFENAPRFQALLVFIEHRFYGKSVPFGGNREVAYANTSTLGYLSSTQALADYATLIIDLKKNISAIDSPVVVFGGSYGGMLAAWFRMKYPHVTIGALASSAPILHFPGLVSPYVFSDTIANDFRSEGENCYNVIKSSWKQIEDAGKTDKGLKLLQKSFRLCKNYSSDFLEGWLQSAWTYTAMTDYPTPSNFMNPLPAYPIRKACSEMIMPLGVRKESMFPESEWSYKSRSDSCQFYYNTTPRPHWITTEFGGYHIHQVLKRSASNIIFFNGLRDPWSGGGVLKSISKTLVAIVAKEGAHHVDLRYSTKEDPKWLTHVREKEIKIIASWIKRYYRDLQL